MTWITRERPKTDRIACPWLIRRFIDPDAEIIYVSAGELLTKLAASASASASVSRSSASADHCVRSQCA